MQPLQYDDDIRLRIQSVGRFKILRTQMNIPGLNEVKKDERFGWYSSKPLSLKLLKGKECCIVIEGYDEDDRKEDFHSTIASLLAADPSELTAAEEFIFHYYEDMNRFWSPSDPEFLAIKSPKDVWNHIQLGDQPIISRRGYGDKEIYISIEGNCDWEVEHGLQIVFKAGVKVCKVGPYDGHLTNSDAYADPSLENVIYRAIDG
jgi:hypothetical protein